MAITEHYFTKFAEGNYYHVYNRSIDRTPLFKNDGNYEFFLKKYCTYLSPVIDTYVFCLLGNHFHLLVSVKKEFPSGSLTTFKKLSNLNMNVQEKSTHDIVSHQFRKFFQSYAMAFNKQQNRIGSLFQTPFKRALIDNPQYLTRLVYYIHSNPQWHCLTNDFRDWKWSSYNTILNVESTKSKKNEVIEWFGNKEYYKQFHEQMQMVRIHKKYNLEDDNEFDKSNHIY